MDNVTLNLLRPSDLLTLDVELVNFRLDSTARPPRAIKDEANKPSFLVVHLPPQHVAERRFTEDDDGNLTDLVPVPVPSVIAYRTRLSFLVPDHIESLPLTLEALLSWAAFEPSVVNNALPHPHPPFSSSFRPGLEFPHTTRTSIDLPFGLVLSTDATAGWAHSIDAVTRGERTELWHTRLGVRRNQQVDETRLPTIRVTFPDHPASFADVLRDDRGLSTTLSPPHRAAIAHASGDFSLRLPAPPHLPYVPVPLAVRHMILSPLGAWTELGGQWGLGGVTLPAEASGVAAWRHIVAMGRDQYVHIAQPGRLFPFGNRASLFATAERKFKLSAGRRTAYLAQRLQIVVDEPERYFGPGGPLEAGYAAAGREMPLKRVRITNLIVTDLDGSAAAGVPFFPTTAGNEVHFHCRAEDAAGNEVEFALPLMFVPVSADQSPEALRDEYHRPVHAHRRRTDLQGQQVFFAPGESSTALKTYTFGFATQVPLPGVLPATEPQFLPMMETAEVGIPAVDHLLEATSRHSMTLHRSYLLHGFDAEQNPGGAFASLATSFDLAVPSRKAGGMAAPSIRVNGLSRAFGPVAAVDTIAVGRFDPLDFFGPLNPKLLGAVELKVLIEAVAAGSGGASLATQVPRLSQKRTSGGFTTEYSWRPNVRRINDGSPGALTDKKLAIVTTANTELKIRAEVTGGTGDGGPISSIEGTLSSFTLSLLDIVGVSFERLYFESNQHRKMNLRAEGVGVEFDGALQFVRSLAAVLPRNGFGDGANVTVRPDGIVAGYSVGIPSAGVGAFSLENIALTATLFLPFGDQPAALQLDFSSSDQPFLVTVSLIGGGGYLSIALTASGIQRIEGSLELGGNITVDLFIVRANVHSMAGLFFGVAMKDGQATLEFGGYVRIGGAVEVLGIVGISMDVQISLKYLPDPAPFGVITGFADVIIGVYLLMFSKSLSLGFKCTFDVETGAITARPRSFDQAVSEDEWHQYCQAFA